MTSYPTETPYPTKTARPTQNPLRAHLEMLIDQRLPFTSFGDPTSSQSQALDWLSKDSYALSLQLSDDRLLQRFALTTAFYAFGVTGQSLENTNECDWSWAIFTCNPQHGVIQLYAQFQLFQSGTLPPELSAVTTLSSLFLGNNGMAGSIPSELSMLSDLENVQLQRNQLTGTIPQGLTKLSNLVNLVLSFNEFTGSVPPGLGDLTNLWNLNLNNNKFRGTIPSELANAAPLNSLTLHNNDLTGTVPSELCAITVNEVMTVDCDEVTCTCDCMCDGV